MGRKKKEIVKKTEETLTPKPKPSSKEILQEIIKRSDAEKFVDVIVIDAPTYGHKFKDYADELKTSTKEFEKFVAVGTFQVACAVTQKQAESLKKDWGIDVYTIVEDVLMNESSSSMIKHLMSRMGEIARKNYLNDYTHLDKIKVKAYNFVNKFHTKKNELGYVSKVEYKKKTKIKSVDQLSKLILREAAAIDEKGKWGVGNFAVCSIKTATLLQQDSKYTMFPIEENVVNPGKPYPIAKIAGITLYVDPYMLWSDTNIYIGVKTKSDYPSIKFFIYVDGLTSELVTKGVGSPKMLYKMRYAMVDVGDSCKHLYRKIEYEDDRKYPLI